MVRHDWVRDAWFNHLERSQLFAAAALLTALYVNSLTAFLEFRTDGEFQFRTDGEL